LGPGDNRVWRGILLVPGGLKISAEAVRRAEQFLQNHS
jgi:hypothetical protein